MWADTTPEQNDPSHNPFAGLPESSFTSAIKPKDTHAETRPVYRRRGSESTVKRSKSSTEYDLSQGEGNGHVRSRTIDNFTVRGNTSTAGKLHPLAAPAVGSSSSSTRSLAETRPRLRRLLSDIDPQVNARGDQNTLAESPTHALGHQVGQQERMVIIHEILPNDSLAGVALKYGISLAELRKANQLWASDPIHLRDVLYIPLDKARKAKDLVLTQLEAQSDVARAQSRTKGDLVTMLENDVPTSPDTPNLTIRRIPASQMSFFPSPSTSVIPLNRSQSSRTLPRSFTASPPQSFNQDLSLAFGQPGSPSSLVFGPAMQIGSYLANGSTRAAGSSLTSLLNKLPLPLPRLSFESATSSPSLASDDQEHELGHMSRNSSSSQRPSDREYFPDTLSKSRKGGASGMNHGELHPYALTSPEPNNSTIRGRGKTRLVSNPPPSRRRGQDYTAPELRKVSAPESVRTAQLEPSPGMQLPLKNGKDREVHHGSYDGRAVSWGTP